MTRRATNLSVTGIHAVEMSLLRRLSETLPGLVHSAMTYGVKVEEQGRRIQNGVVEPGSGKCKRIWEALDGLLNTGAPTPTLQTVYGMAATNEWDDGMTG